MADTLTLAEDEARQAEQERTFARQDRGNRLDQAKNEARTANDFTRRHAQIPPAAAAADAGVRDAYKKAWMGAEEYVEDLIPPVGTILLAPVIFAFFFFRLIAGNLNDGSGRIDFNGVSVDRVQRYGFIEGFYRAGKLLWILLINLIFYSLVILLVYIITNPLEAAQNLGFGPLWEALKALGAILFT